MDSIKLEHCIRGFYLRNQRLPKNEIFIIKPYERQLITLQLGKNANILRIMYC